MKKDIYIGLLTPWGVPLLEKTLQNWSDVDINKFMELHNFIVYSSMQETKGRYHFKLIRNNTYLALEEQIKKTNEVTNKLKNITLQGVWTDQKQHITLDGVFSTRSSFINMHNYIKDAEEEVLIINDSNSSNTVLHLTGITPYIILFFDKERKFKGASYSIQNGDGDFRINTSYRYILFVKHPHEINLDSVLYLNFRY